MKITKKRLRDIIREESNKTPKYDEDSALRGDQSELPDPLQKAIIDDVVEDREDAEKANEAIVRTRKMIRRMLAERRTGNPALHEEESALIQATEKFYDKYMLVMGMNPRDPHDLKRTRRTIDDLIGAVLDVL